MGHVRRCRHPAFPSAAAVALRAIRGPQSMEERVTPEPAAQPILPNSDVEAKEMTIP